MPPRPPVAAGPSLAALAEGAVPLRPSKEFTGVSFAPASFAFLARVQGAQVDEPKEQEKLMGEFARNVLRSAEGEQFGDVSNTQQVGALPAEFLSRLFQEWIGTLAPGADGAGGQAEG